MDRSSVRANILKNSLKTMTLSELHCTFKRAMYQECSKTVIKLAAALYEAKMVRGIRQSDKKKKEFPRRHLRLFFAVNPLDRLNHG